VRKKEGGRVNCCSLEKGRRVTRQLGVGVLGSESIRWNECEDMSHVTGYVYTLVIDPLYERMSLCNSITHHNTDISRIYETTMQT